MLYLNSLKTIRKQKGIIGDETLMVTHFISDERMLAHKCEWDDTHIEKPQRLQAILDTLEDSQILQRCNVLEPTMCTLDDLKLVHSLSYIDEIRSTSTMSMEEQELYCQTKEDIYVNSHTFECSLLSAGCAVKAMEATMDVPGSNAFAAIRPPGHHASRDTPCGFCIFNNVVICAKKARQRGIERVLILDWDVHAGQGTQYAIKDEPGILAISIHRFENGKFWPELSESSINQNYENTINVPINQLGYGDSEYKFFIDSLVLPLIHQWKPQLILVSCGFDAAIGDPQGEMSVSPLGFSYMTGILASINIPLCLLLEGGYFIDSLAKGFAYCIDALLMRKPSFEFFGNTFIKAPTPRFLSTLYATLIFNAKQFPIFSSFAEIVNFIRAERGLTIIRSPMVGEEYKGSRAQITKYETRNCYPSRDPLIEEEYRQKLHAILDSSKDDALKSAPKLIINFKNGDVHFFDLNRLDRAFESIHIPTKAAFYFFYFYIALPLSIQYQLIIDGSPIFPPYNLEEFASKCVKNVSELEQKDENPKKFAMDINSFIDSFECIKPFFLF